MKLLYVPAFGILKRRDLDPNIVLELRSAYVFGLLWEGEQ